MLTTKYDKLGKKLDTIFPLLDPALDEDVAKLRHLEAWQAQNTFVTQTGQGILHWVIQEMDDIGRAKFIDILCQQCPVVM